MGAKPGNRNNVIHGKSGTRLYRIWKSMRSRCMDKNMDAYKNYGARGISICKEWDDFNNFYNWAYSNGYDENAEYMKCTLDRIDNDGNYEPSNCRFVDWKEQSRNKRTNRKFLFKGKMTTLPEIADETGLARDLLYDRIIRRNWSVEKATTTPIKKHINANSDEFKRYYEKYKSKEMSARKICQELDICHHTFKSMLSQYEHGNLHIRY